MQDVGMHDVAAAPLKLIALDGEDLRVVSAHLQDAVVCSANDVIWLPAEKRLVIGLNRFDWESALEGAGHYHRRRAALRFERVNALKARNLKPGEGKVLNLLAVDFAENDAPSGIVTLTFSGDIALRLEVECLEAELADLGPAWDTARCPDHPESAARA
jgi:hypothetical protein